MYGHMARKSLWVLSLLAALLWGLVPVESAAQTLYGSLVGNVVDSTGAVVPGATVTITHRATNQTRTAVTNEAGGYNFPSIQTGAYDVKVSKEGFTTFSTSGVEITINTVTRVDAALRVGSVAETVTVNAEAALLQTDRSEVRAEIGAAALENMPVPLGRNYQHLLRTVAGIRPPSNAHSVPTNPSRALTFNANGVSQSINNTRIDGASSTNVWLPHITAFVPTLESIETVNIVTNSFDAEQGLAGGAAVNVQIRSGTNDIHGSAFEYHTNNNLKARPYFMPPEQDKPKLVFNEFGGTLGGPIKRDRLFYFMSYEGNYHREFASRFGTVPTAAMKRGDMSESNRDIYDPLTGDADGRGRTIFPNRQVPAGRISAIARRLADLTPLPNVRGLENTFANNNYYAGAPFSFDRHRADTKVNWTASQKLSMFGRFSILHYDMFNQEMFGELGGPEISGYGGNPGAATGRTYSFTAAATYVFSPTFLLDAYYGYTRMDTSVEQSRLDEKLGLEFLGLPGTNGPRRFEGGWPRFSISGFTNLGLNNDFMPYDRRDPQYQYVANFNWTKGNHEVRFGFDFYNQHMNHLQPEAPGAFHGASGGFTFGGGPTQLRDGAAGNQFNSYAAFLLGLPTQRGRIHQVPDEYNTRAWLNSLYVRDRWNVNRKLTLSYGVRWEYFPFPTRADRGLEVYDPSTNKMMVCGVGDVPENCGVEESKKRFAPRVGIAYRASDTFVIRAGYGITNDPFSLARPFRTNYPILLILNEEGPNSFQPVGRFEQGISAVRVPDLGNGIIDIPPTFAAFTVPKKFPRGYVQSWNLTLQKQIGWGFVGQAGYVATRSVRQIGYLDMNAGQIPGAGQNGRPLRQRFGRTATTTLVTPFGTAMYDSLQTSLERRFSNGLQMNISYTWSKALGYNENSDSGPRRTAALQFFDLNRTVQPYDRTHQFSLSSVWELPFGRGRRWLNSGPASWIIGGWQVNNLLSLYSGTPFTVTSSGTSLDMPGSSQTADQVLREVRILGGVGRGSPYFDPLAFRPVTERRFGTAGWLGMRGPGIVNWDFGLFREFPVTERFRLQFRMEAFNFTNTPHFSNPGGNVSDADINFATSEIRRLGGFSEITGVTNLGREGIDERQFRFGLRLQF